MFFTLLKLFPQIELQTFPLIGKCDYFKLEDPENYPSLCCCTRAFSSCGEQGLLLIAVRRLLIAVASLVAEHGL